LALRFCDHEIVALSLKFTSFRCQLGCPWSSELDGGNPYEDNGSCLVRTVQRALLAQTLLRLPVCDEDHDDNDDNDDDDDEMIMMMRIMRMMMSGIMMIMI
jgi:hypothetical protein